MSSTCAWIDCAAREIAPLRLRSRAVGPFIRSLERGSILHLRPKMGPGEVLEILRRPRLADVEIDVARHDVAQVWQTALERVVDERGDRQKQQDGDRYQP